MSDADKLKALRDGMFFLGDTEPRRVPVYIKNRLLFDNDYTRPYVLFDNKVIATELNVPVEMIQPEHLAQYAFKHYKQGNFVLEEYSNKLYVPFLGLDKLHKRYIRRKPTEFFKANFEKIHSLKVDFSKSSFNRMLDLNNWNGRSTWPAFAIAKLKDCFEVARPYGGLSNWYVTFYGCPLDRVPDLPVKDYKHFWFSRYDDFYEFYDSSAPLPAVSGDKKVDFEFLNNELDEVFKLWTQWPRQRSKDEREKDYLTDLFKSIDY